MVTSMQIYDWILFFYKYYIISSYLGNNRTIVSIWQMLNLLQRETWGTGELIISRRRQVDWLTSWMREQLVDYMSPL